MPAGRNIEDDPTVIEKDVPIPLLDGHVMYCNVFRPAAAARVPPIIAFTPYRKDSDVAVDFKRSCDFVLRDHPEVVQDGSSGSLCSPSRGSSRPATPDSQQTAESPRKEAEHRQIREPSIRQVRRSRLLPAQ